jgi:hypothetical protein
LHPLVKIIFGVLLVVGSIWWVFQGPDATKISQLVYQWTGIQPTGYALGDIVTLANGGAPAFLFLLGIFIIWLELDEWKIEKELAVERPRKK